MDQSIRINRIIQQIESLDDDAKLNLMERLISLLKRKKQVTSTRLTALNGLGSEIWKGVDVVEYLQSERQWD